MFVDYSTQEGVIEGAKQTFDGQHPCGLCNSISKAKKDDRSDPKLPGGREVRGFEMKLQLAVAIANLRKPLATELPSLSFFPPSGLNTSFRPRPEMPPPRFC